MFLAAEPYGWMEWWGFGLGLGSFVLAILGFLLGWNQIRKVRTAANAAREASEKVVRRVSDRITLEELDTLRTLLSSLRLAIRNKQREAATIYCGECRRRLAALEFREGFALPEGDGESLADGLRTLTSIETALTRREPDQPWKGVTKTEDARVIALDNKVAQWTARTRAQQTEERS